MQTILCSLIIVVAALYLANRWISPQFKQRLMRMFGKTISKQSTSACDSCSSCGNCGNDGSELAKPIKFAKK